MRTGKPFDYDREVARQLGVNPGTLWRWQRRYGGVQVDEARRLFMLEKENSRLKRIVAELELAFGQPGLADDVFRPLSWGLETGARTRLFPDRDGDLDRGALRA